MKGTLLELLEPRGLSADKAGFWEDRKTAFVFWDGKPPYHLGKLSYRGLRKKAQRFASALLNELDVVPGERLAIMLPNALQFPIVYFGAQTAGIIPVPINPRYSDTPNEISKILKDSGAETIVTLDRWLPALEAIKKEVRLRHIIVTTPADTLPFIKKAAYLIKALWKKEYFYYPNKTNPKEVVSYASLLSAGMRKKVKVNIKPGDLALILYTSGTTGAPKGVMMTHRALLENAKWCREYLIKMGLHDGEETFLAAAPYFHILWLAALLHTALAIRAKTVLVPDPRNVPQIMKATAFIKATAFAGMPGHYEIMGKALATNLERYDLSSIKLWINGGAKLHRVYREKFERLVGKKIRNCYGMSELGIVSCQLLDDDEEDSVGEPFDGVLPIILNPDKEGVGELVIQSPSAQIMSGNLLHTGDLAKISKRGRSVRIILGSRQKYLIKTRSGEGVDPLEVEKVLMIHPHVVEAAVVGVEDERHGERIRACVVLLLHPRTSCVEIFQNSIKEHCGKFLASFKIPNEIICVEQIEKNAAGKILYEKLKELKAST